MRFFWGDRISGWRLYGIDVPWKFFFGLSVTDKERIDRK